VIELLVLAALCTAAWWWSSVALWVVAGVFLLCFGLRRFRHSANQAVLATAQQSGQWRKAWLHHQQTSGEWEWRVDVQAEPPFSFAARSTGHFRDRLPLEVEVCELGDRVWALRHGAEALLTRQVS
jgi:hypothetical protein